MVELADPAAAFIVVAGGRLLRLKKWYATTSGRRIVTARS